MTEPVLRPLQADPATFIEETAHARKQEEAWQLTALFTEVTGFEPILWGGGIIGFGTYHYRYDSGREGDAPLAAFAPRKVRHSIYVEPKFPEKEELLTRLGKYKASLGCIYVNKLADIDLAVLRELLVASTAETLRRYG